MTVKKLLHRYGVSPKTETMTPEEFDLLMREANRNQIFQALITSSTTVAQARELTKRAAGL